MRCAVAGLTDEPFVAGQTLSGNGEQVNRKFWNDKSYGGPSSKHKQMNRFIYQRWVDYDASGLKSAAVATVFGGRRRLLRLQCDRFGC
jgi:hypothetical protein